MHEMGIAQNILEIALEAANKEGATRISRIDLVAGELRGLVPMQMTFCFGIVAQNTIASGAYLNIEETPVTAHCEDCGTISQWLNISTYAPNAPVRRSR